MLRATLAEPVAGTTPQKSPRQRMAPEFLLVFWWHRHSCLCLLIIPAESRMQSKLVEKQLLYNGKKVRLELHHLEDEDTQSLHVREVVVHPGAVVVLGFLPDEKVLL